MDLNLSKLEQKEVVQQTTQAQSNNGVAETKEKSSKPIDFSNEKTNENSKKNIEILDYLNSEEFKNLSEEEQIKAFKEKYGLGLSDKELSETLKNAKKVAAEFEQRTIIASGEEVQTTNVASSNDATKAEITAKQDIIEDLKQKGIEKPTQGDVYDYLVQLQANGIELTAEQSKMLKTFNALLDNGFQGLKPSQNEKQPTQPQKESLIPAEVVLSENFKNKEPEEKLNIYMDAYLTANDPEYAKLSDKAKKEYRLEKTNEFVNTIGRDGRKPNTTAFVAISILDDAHRKGEPIKDFSDKSLAQKADIAVSNQMKKGIQELLKRKEFSNGCINEQMQALGDILFANNEEYAKMDKDEKVAYVQKELQDKLDIMGIPVKIDYKNTSLIVLSKKDLEERKDRNVNFQCLTWILKDFAEQPEDITIKDYMAEYSTSIDANKKLVALIDKNLADPDLKINHRGAVEDFKEVLVSQKDIYTQLQKQGITDPKPKDVYKYLTELEKTRNLSPAEEKIKKESQAMIQLDERYEKVSLNSPAARLARQTDITKRSDADAVALAYKTYGKDTNAMNEFLLAKILSNNGENTESILKELSKHCSPEEMQNYRKTVYDALGISGIGQNDSDKITKSIKANPDPRRGGKMYAVAAGLTTKECRTQVTAECIMDEQGSKAVTYGTQNCMNIDEATEILRDTNDLNIIPKNVWANFSKNYITEAKKLGSDVQLDFAERLSSFGNSAITEGVAAASDSIDPSILNKYNQIVENAISSGNYSSSDTEKIRNALKTGNISQETLADTSIPEPKTDKTNNNTTNSETQNTNSATETKQAAQTQPTQPQSQPQPAVSASATATAQSGQTISQIINTISTPSNTASATASATNKNTSTTKTQDTSSTKKAEALNKAAETKASIDNSIKEWEKTHNQKMNSSDIATLKSAVSSDVIDDVLKDPQATEEVKSYVRNLVENATSINDLYTKLVSIYGSKVQNKFVEVLASNGSTAAIHNFAENNGSKEIIKDLYIKCGSSTLKSELLNLLPPTTVSEMLAARQIDDLATVDYKVLKEFVLKNISSMSNSDFNYYLRYLPFDERQALVKARLSQSDFTGTEGGEIGMYAEKLGFKTNSQSQVNPTQPLIQKQGGVNNDSPFSSKREDEQVLDDGIEPFFDTLENAPLDEFTNETDTNYPPGSDEWESHIRSMQTGIKVPPSSVYATYTPEDRDIDWEIGSAGATKLPFGRNYDKQKRGTVYWG